MSIPAGAAGVLLVLLGAVLMGLLPAVSVADSCPNAAERFGPSVNLPDCRAYELVTPRFKGDNSSLELVHGFADGEHVFYSSILPMPGSGSGEEGQALSSRTPEGWVTTPLTIPAGPGEPYGYNEGSTGLTAGARLIHAVSFTGDFSAAFVNSPFQYGALDQNKQWNMFRVGVPSGAVSIESLPEGGAMTEALIDPPNVDSTTTLPPRNYVPGAFIAGNSADGRRVFFETSVKLPVAAGSPEDTHTTGNELFERHDGHTYLAGLLPGGSVPTCGAEVGFQGVTSMSEGYELWAKLGFTFSDYGSVSLDGSNVVFHSPGMHSACSEPEKTYLRVDNGQPDARTVELPGTFLARTVDQKKLLLTSEGLLYEYDIASGQTVTVGDGLSNNTYSGLIAASADGSRVYSSPGYESGERLSLYEDGVIKPTPIPAAGLRGRVLPFTWAPNNPVASRDGSKLAFVDTENLTSYDSKGHREVYVYDATNDSIACVSCNPDGSSPQRDSGLLSDELENGENQNPEAEGLNDPENAFTPDSYPAVSNDDAHVFFNSREALVPQDTNGIEDVYEWERAGTGTCGTSNPSYSPASGGCVYLISSGTGSKGSLITGASEDGSNVFFISTESLAPQVIESAQQIYDARVDSGFPYVAPKYGCDSGQCQGPQTPAPPLLAPPPSATFVGVGNPAPETSTKAKPKSKTPKHKKRPKQKHKGKRRKANQRTGKGRK
jgi:hypothetical protein